MPAAQYTSIRYTDRLDRHIWALDAGFLAEEISPTVPAPVLAEAWRGGGRQPNSAT
jgi:hypothetical protein